MLRKLFALPVLGLVAIAAMPSAVKAQEYGFDAGNWELTLAGGGSNSHDFDSVAFSVSGSIGYFFTDNLELALRQSIGYTDATGNEGSEWKGTSDLALDWHFDLGRWQPFIGANLGYTYGQDVEDSFIAGPELGVKYFITQSTFIQVLAQYEFSFNGSDANGDDLSNGIFNYSLGLGVKL